MKTQDRVVDVVSFIVLVAAIAFGIGVGFTVKDLLAHTSSHADLVGTLTGIGAAGLVFGVAVTFMLVADVLKVLRIHTPDES